MNIRQLRRQTIINQIKRTVSEATERGELIHYRPFVAKLCVETGLARRTIVEYVDLLIESGEIIHRENVMYTNAEKVFAELKKHLDSLTKIDSVLDPYDPSYHSEKEKDDLKKYSQSLDIDNFTVNKKEDGNRTTD